MTVIPQDPTLFSASLRQNIDPTGQLKDAKIMEVLKKAGLDTMLTKDKEASKDMTDNLLDFEIEESGNNLSSGEK